ncbi:MAG: capsular biosynthesis protein [Porticoccaceae bacterium]|nr:capsular biosynthesis protein [Porticoccaceae bacterium]
MGFIDIHSHLLPGIDDGAPDMGVAVSMARTAVAGGISHLVCTPHIHPGRFDNTAEEINQGLTAFKLALREAGIALNVSSAAEVHFGIEIMVAVNNGTVPFLGSWEGCSVLLLEFPHGHIPSGAERLTQWLIDRQIVPLIAHPERNRKFISAPGRLKTYLDQGCLLQVTASSLTGRFGESAQELAEKLITDYKVTILASDSHDLVHRPPVLSEGLEIAARLAGNATATRLVIDNPWKIAESLFL